MTGCVLVAITPERALAFTFDADGRCCVVPPGTTREYLGQSVDDVWLAMSSVLRYEDGTEPQPNTGHSANGYPQITVVRWQP